MIILFKKVLFISKCVYALILQIPNLILRTTIILRMRIPKNKFKFSLSPPHPVSMFVIKLKQYKFSTCWTRMRNVPSEQWIHPV